MLFLYKMRQQQNIEDLLGTPLAMEVKEEQLHLNAEWFLWKQII